MHLVIGGHGLIGTALCSELAARGIRHQGTSRRNPDGGMILFDLAGANMWNNIAMLPLPADVKAIYLVAAVVGYSACEKNPFSWLINVDGTIALARHYHRSFPVFISSDVVEMSGTAAYQVQKRTVESYIHSIDGAIIRPGRVAPERAGELAKVIVDVRLARRPGVTRWA